MKFGNPRLHQQTQRSRAALALAAAGAAALCLLAMSGSRVRRCCRLHPGCHCKVQACDWLVYRWHACRDPQGPSPWTPLPGREAGAPAASCLLPSATAATAAACSTPPARCAAGDTTCWWCAWMQTVSGSAPSTGWLATGRCGRGGRGRDTAPHGLHHSVGKQLAALPRNIPFVWSTLCLLGFPPPASPWQGHSSSVGALKFGAVRRLLQAGFHPLLMDLDLFLIASDPLADMLPLR